MFENTLTTVKFGKNILYNASWSFTPESITKSHHNHITMALATVETSGANLYFKCTLLLGLHAMSPHFLAFQYFLQELNIEQIQY